MKLGGWQSGPKKSSRKEVKEYKMKRRMRLAEFVAKKREQKEEQGREGSNFEESSSRGFEKRLVLVMFILILCTGKGTL